MHTYVYRSSKKDGLYLYLPKPIDECEIPDAVLLQMGEPELALSFLLNKERKLNQEDPATVLSNLQSQGFHIQMPHDIEDQITAIAQQAITPKPDS